MITLLNYAHPLTELQMQQLAVALGETPQIHQISSQIDRSQPLAEVAMALANAAPLDVEMWQTHRLLINPPSLAPLALALIAEVHGRCGYFPPILNIRPVLGAVPPQYELGELVDLNDVRQLARMRRGGSGG